MWVHVKTRKCIGHMKSTHSTQMGKQVHNHHDLMELQEGFQPFYLSRVRYQYGSFISVKEVKEANIVHRQGMGYVLKRATGVRSL